jgi:hypothetical protein
MVEQRPFKALVVGSSPTQPTFRLSALAPGETTVRAPRRVLEPAQERHYNAAFGCILLLFFRVVLADFDLFDLSWVHR